jgi:hypothetical protein
MQPTRTLCERDWPNKVNFSNYANAIKQPKKYIPKKFLKTEKLITINKLSNSSAAIFAN